MKGMESVQPDTEAIATNLGFLVDLIRARDDFARLLALLRFGHGALADGLRFCASGGEPCWGVLGRCTRGRA